MGKFYVMLAGAAIGLLIAAVTKGDSLSDPRVRLYWHRGPALSAWWVRRRVWHRVRLRLRTAGTFTGRRLTATHDTLIVDKQEG